MRSYSETAVFDPGAVSLFRRATEVVAGFPDPGRGSEPWRCHEVARVVGRLLGLPFVDGLYGAVDHSWLSLPWWSAILDVYSVGALPLVRLVDLGRGLPHETAYRAGPARTDIREAAIAALGGLETFILAEMELRAFGRHPTRVGYWIAPEIGNELVFRDRVVRRWVERLWPDVAACRKRFREELDPLVAKALGYEGRVAP